VTDLHGLAGGLWRTQLLSVAARLGIADRLASGPRTAAELADETGADAGALFRVLRALASLGVFSQDAEDRFGPTEASERLRPSAPGSPHSRVVLYGEDWWWAAAGGLYETVMTGAPGFDRVHGAALFDWLQERPDASATFDAHMTAMTAGEAEAVVAVADLPERGTVVDVGGGRGTLLAAILRAHPGLRGVLFDQPHVVAGAVLPERCEAVAGSFFTAVPAGAEVYTLKDIVHDWDDERALAVLRTVRAAIGDRGRLLVVERALPPGDEPAPGKLVDITMLLITGGRERTRDEYARLLSQAGFRLASVAPTAAGTDVLTALPV
jgi:O-methyltransferase domain/Dimerisation domain